MPSRKNRYRNCLGVGSILRWCLIVLVLGGIALAYVYTKNSYVAKGNRLRALEEEIRQLETEMEEIELKIASTMDRVSIDRLLRTIGSDLTDIDSRFVEHVEAPAPAPMAVNVSPGSRVALGPVLRPATPGDVPGRGRTP